MSKAVTCAAQRIVLLNAISLSEVLASLLHVRDKRRFCITSPSHSDSGTGWCCGWRLVAGHLAGSSSSAHCLTIQSTSHGQLGPRVKAIPLLESHTQCRDHALCYRLDNHAQTCGATAHKQHRIQVTRVTLQDRTSWAITKAVI